MALEPRWTAGKVRPPRIGLVTDSSELVQSVARALARYSAILSVAETAAEAQDLLVAEDLDAKIIDHGAGAAIPLPYAGCAACPLLRSSVKADELVLLGPTSDSPRSCTVRGSVYRRADLDLLLEELSRILHQASVAVAVGSERILGEGPVIQLVREQVRSVARYRDVAVLVLGETGTGKELVAQAIHAAGGGEQPFVAINCAAIPDNLFESELFGHEAGAYTGARGLRVGLLESAANGTVFLDEIGEMPLQVQAKLLRVLETRMFRRVGSNRDVPLTARVISATNRGTGSSEGALRSDLLYRLAGFTIALPALRDRAEDIPLLAASFLQAFGERHRVEAKQFSTEAMAALQTQPWPGNVRELRSVVEHVAILATHSVISEVDVRSAIARIPHNARVDSTPSDFNVPSTAIRPTALVDGMIPRTGSSGPAGSVGGLRSIERELITRTFDDCARNLSRAARQLDIPRSTLRDKLRRYGVL